MSKVENQGLKVYNDNNQLCIDSNYSNLELKRVVKFGDLPLRSRDSDFVYRNLTLQSGEVLVAREINTSPILTGSSGGSQNYNAVNIYNCSFANEIGTYCYAVGLNYNQTGYAIANPESYANELRLFVFGTPDQSEGNTGDAGLKVYDKSGQVIYDSNKKYMRVIGIPPNSIFGTDYDVTHSKYAVVESSMNLPDYAYGGFGSDNKWHACAFYCRVNAVYLGPHTINLAQDTAFLPGNAINVYTLVPLLSGCFVLDVTNY